MINPARFPEIGSYPAIKNKSAVYDWAQEVNRERGKDKTKWQNLPNLLLQGRLRNGSRAEPSSSADVLDSDSVYDWYLSATTLWVLLDDSGLTWKSLSWGAGGGGGISRTIISTSGSFTAGASASTDYIYFITGAHSPTMPTAVGNTNRYTFKNNHTASINIGTSLGQTIDSSATYTLLPSDAIDLISNNSNWFII